MNGEGSEEAAPFVLGHIEERTELIEDENPIEDVGKERLAGLASGLDDLAIARQPTGHHVLQVIIDRRAPDRGKLQKIRYLGWHRMPPT